MVLTLVISSCFFLLDLILLLANNTTEVSIEKPAMPQPIGPAKASKACPPAMPRPPLANVPPPSQARAALVAAAPDKAEIAVPVDAVPKVVATHIAAVGAKAVTAAPAATPAPAVPASFFAFDNSLSAKS